MMCIPVIMSPLLMLSKAVPSLFQLSMDLKTSRSSHSASNLSTYSRAKESNLFKLTLLTVMMTTRMMLQILPHKIRKQLVIILLMCGH